jgi:hypothetical protein
LPKTEQLSDDVLAILLVSKSISEKDRSFTSRQYYFDTVLANAQAVENDPTRRLLTLEINLILWVFHPVIAYRLLRLKNEQTHVGIEDATNDEMSINKTQECIALFDQLEFGRCLKSDVRRRVREFGRLRRLNARSIRDAFEFGLLTVDKESSELKCDSLSLRYLLITLMSACIFLLLAVVQTESALHPRSFCNEFGCSQVGLLLSSALLYSHFLVICFLIARPLALHRRLSKA